MFAACFRTATNLCYVTCIIATSMRTQRVLEGCVLYRERGMRSKMWKYTRCSIFWGGKFITAGNSDKMTTVRGVHGLIKLRHTRR